MNKRTRFSGANSILTLEASTKQRKTRKKKAPFHPPVELAPYLQIQSVSLGERVDPYRNSYILVIQPYGIRAAGGQYTASEAHEIAQATRGWDWSLNENAQPQCWQELESLLDSLCKRSEVKKNILVGGDSLVSGGLVSDRFRLTVSFLGGVNHE